jgi:hypothetical protein
MLQLHEAEEKGKRADVSQHLRYDAVARGCGKGKTCCRVAIPTRCCSCTRPRKKENVLSCRRTYFMMQSHEAVEKGKRAVASLYLLDVAAAGGRGKRKTCCRVRHHNCPGAEMPLSRRCIAAVSPLSRRCHAAVPPLSCRCPADVPPMYRR